MMKNVLLGLILVGQSLTASLLTNETFKSITTDTPLSASPTTINGYDYTSNDSCTIMTTDPIETTILKAPLYNSTAFLTVNPTDYPSSNQGDYYLEPGVTISQLQIDFPQAINLASVKFDYQAKKNSWTWLLVQAEVSGVWTNIVDPARIDSDAGGETVPRIYEQTGINFTNSTAIRVMIWGNGGGSADAAFAIDNIQISDLPAVTLSLDSSTSELDSFVLADHPWLELADDTNGDGKIDFEDRNPQVKTDLSGNEITWYFCNVLKQVTGTVDGTEEIRMRAFSGNYSSSATPAAKFGYTIIDLGADVTGIEKFKFDWDYVETNGSVWIDVQYATAADLATLEMQGETSWSTSTAVKYAASANFGTRELAIPTIATPVRYLRIRMWGNGSGADNDNFAMDNFQLLPVGGAPMEISAVTSANSEFTTAYKTGLEQAVYPLIIETIRAETPYSLKSINFEDISSTDLAADVTSFKLYRSTGDRFDLSTATELLTTGTITPANLSTVTLATPELLVSKNYIWLVATLDGSATENNTINLKATAITVNNGADELKTVLHSENDFPVTIVGIENRSVYLNETSIDFGNNTELRSDDQFTLECLFQVTDLSKIRTIIGCKSNGSYFGLKLAVQTDGRLTYGFKAGNAFEPATPETKVDYNINAESAPGTVVVDSWYHVAVTYNSTSATDNDVILYLNGTELTRYDVDDKYLGGSGGNVWNKEFRFIGSDYYGSDFVGYIDEVRLWNSARTAQQIFDNREPGSVNATRALDPDLQFYCDFNSFDQEKAYDQVNGFTGDLVATHTGSGDSYQATSFVPSGTLFGPVDYESVTPVLGLEFTQDGINVSWSVTEEIGVKEYRLINVKTGEVIEVITADGSVAYETTVPENCQVKLVVVDQSGHLQTFFPTSNDDIVIAYELSKGWNLISIATENSDFSKINKMTTGDFWTWNGEAYELTSAPEVTEGVWVYSHTSGQTTISGKKSTKGLKISTGWNLVGPTVNTLIPEQATTVYTWNEVYEDVLTKQNVLIQGVGYWIFSF